MLLTGPGPLEGGAELDPRPEELEDEAGTPEVGTDLEGPDVGSGSPRG